jgi:hypothetical protein
MDELVHHAQTISRPTTLDRYTKIGDRPWNDPGKLFPLDESFPNRLTLHPRPTSRRADQLRRQPTHSPRHYPRFQRSQ